MRGTNNLTRDEARRRSELVGDLQYDVALDLTSGAETFVSDTTIRFACREAGVSTFVDLVAPRVRTIELNGAAVAADRFDGARIHLDGLEATNELHVVADCAYENTGVGLHRFVDPVDGEAYLYSQFESFDAHRVYPCFDQPDLKATFSFAVTAPEGWEVVSNAPALAGGPQWRFATTAIMPAYITAFVAGPYHSVRDRHGEIELGLFCRRSLARYLDAEEIFELTKAGLEFFTKTFDYPYVFGKYDQLFVPEFNAGAMENAGCVTFSERYVFRSKVTAAERERRAETILHEMAHMWFGDLVTMRWWDDLWLNESFASYMSMVALVDATRFRNAWTTFANAWKTWAYRQDQLPSTHPIVADAPDIDTVKVNFDGITYAKGASVLRQLVAWVGEDEFATGVRSYFRRHEFGNTELGDFLGALEQSSGRDLQSWSAEWLEKAGVNTLRASFDTSDGLFTSFSVDQEAPATWPTLRSHRVGVGLYDLEGGSLVRREHVELDAVGARTAVPALVGTRVPELVLVNDGDLAYAKIRLDDRS
ncbi:MAG: aminopeptidase N, partial [Actinobacteria bacterium]